MASTTSQHSESVDSRNSKNPMLSLMEDVYGILTLLWMDRGMLSTIPTKLFLISVSGNFEGKVDSPPTMMVFGTHFEEDGGETQLLLEDPSRGGASPVQSGNCGRPQRLAQAAGGART